MRSLPLRHNNEIQQCFENFQAQNGLNLGRISTAPPVSQHGFNIFTVTHHLHGIWVWELTNLTVVRELKGCENLCGFECYIFLAHFMSKYAFLQKKKRKKKTVKLIGIIEEVELIITVEIMQMCELFSVMISVNSDSKQAMQYPTHAKHFDNNWKSVVNTFTVCNFKSCCTFMWMSVIIWVIFAILLEIKQATGWCSL